MKRNDAVDAIRWILLEAGDDAIYEDARTVALRVLSYMEDIGMLPPLSTCTLVPDPLRGGVKHGETKREWDDETQ